MTYSSANINYLWAHLIVEELVRNQITHFCISPGSRSAPLTVAAVEQPKAKTTICLDERGAAFYGLGYSKATKKPAAIICTSGTAAANYYPAVIEAFQFGLPLVILTADRPPELRATGANQAIDQVKLYGDFVHFFFDLPCPAESIAPEFVLTIINQAVAAAKDGPVHLNCMFREPLAPEEQPVDLKYLHTLKDWNGRSNPYTVYARSSQHLNTSEIKLIGKADQGLLIAGPGLTQDEAGAIRQLAAQLQWPLFADIASAIFRSVDNRPVINYFDQLLNNPQFRELVKTDTIIQFGRPPTSKRLLQFIKDLQPNNYIVVDKSDKKFDPDHRVSVRVQSRAVEACEYFKKSLQRETNSNRLDRLKQFDFTAHQLIGSSSQNDLNEISAAHIIAREIPADTGLFLASSMPIRDMDMFASFNHSGILIGANRGVSGIDGTIASAAGFASGLGRPVTLLVGDIAAIHDLNSLSLVKSSQYPIYIIILNNDGGGIFSFLPIAQYSDVFDHFKTSHGFDFAAAGNQFKIPYAKADSVEELGNHYAKICAEDQSGIIEIKSNLEQNHLLHQEIQDKFTELSL